MIQRSLRLSTSLKTIALGATLSVAPVTGFASPQEGVIATGTASITNGGTLTTIQQSTDRAAIDWRSFDVGVKESVIFKQPSASSITLNRIHDQKPSEIFGSISSNGMVALVNPNGFLFGKSSSVDVAGLVASTADISNEAFMLGSHLEFNKAGNAGATIINKGTITAKQAGLVGLVAPNVENDGFIGAKLGKVQLAGADTFTFDFYGDGLINVAITNKDTLHTLVENKGTLLARTGEIILTAAQAEQLVSSTVNNSGVIDVSGSKLDAKGLVVFGDGIGGDIKIDGGDIHIQSSAKLNAGGANGGGTINIGGGFRGKKLTLGSESGSVLANAKKVTIDSGAAIYASATKQGDGGKVVLWSEEATRFNGSIQSKAGKVGNGGLVETSSHGNLGVSGSVDASTSNGMNGQWLLDPQNVSISGAGVNSVPVGGGVYNPNGAANPYTVLASSISAALTAGNSVTITTVNGGQAQTGDITLAGATISKTGGGNAILTLKADGSILTTGTNSISSNTGQLKTIFWSDADNSGAGAITLTNTTVNSNAGDIILGGGLDNAANGGTAGDGIPDNYSIGSSLSEKAGITLDNTTLSVTSGAIQMRGRGFTSAAASDLNGIYISNGSQVLATGGSITATGFAGVGTSFNNGIRVDGPTTLVQASSGTISLTGVGAGSGAGQTNAGVALYNGIINTTGGSITVNGTGGAGSGLYNDGVEIGGSVLVRAATGSIDVTGTGSTAMVRAE